LIGVLGTLFTGVFVSKALIELFVSKTGSMNFGQPKIISNTKKGEK
jgi:preprotein translocase subunit SecD